MKTVSLEVINYHCKSLTPKQQNPTSLLIENVTTPALAQPGSLCFANSEELVHLALTNKASALIVTDKLYEALHEKLKEAFAKITVWTTPHIQYSMSEVLPFFNSYTPINEKIHPTAQIDPTAKIGENCVIEPFVVIGKHVTVGDHTKIGAHSTLENNSQVGHHSQLSAHVFVGHNCQIGNYCIIGPHNVFGSDGFGFFTDKTGTHHKIPQIGNVVIEDNCEFGAHNAVDRAALTETRIKKGSKFDNLTHIAHNCVVGENALITTGFILAGSTKIGKNLTTAGAVHINGHINVTDNVILTARAGVVSSIEKSGIYGGYPLTDHKENLKILTSTAALPKLRKQVSKIMKHLGLNED